MFPKSVDRGGFGGILDKAEKVGEADMTRLEYRTQNGELVVVIEDENPEAALAALRSVVDGWFDRFKSNG